MLVSGDTFVSRDTSGLKFRKGCVRSDYQAYSAAMFEKNSADFSYTCKSSCGGCGEGDLELQPGASDGGDGVLGLTAAAAPPASPLPPPMGLPPLSPPTLSSSSLLMVP